MLLAVVAITKVLEEEHLKQYLIIDEAIMIGLLVVAALAVAIFAVGARS